MTIRSVLLARATCFDAVTVTPLASTNAMEGLVPVDVPPALEVYEALTVATPAVPLLTVTLALPPEVSAEVALREAVTGETVNVTGEPSGTLWPVRSAVTVEVVVLSATTVVGLTETGIVKVPTGGAVKVTVTLAERAPEVAVMVALPAVPLFTVIEALLFVVVADGGIRVAVPETTAKLTVVPSGTAEPKVAVSVEVVVSSATRLAGDAERANVPGATAMKVIVVFAARPPDVAVMVALPAVPLFTVTDAWLLVVAADVALNVAVPETTAKLTVVPSGTAELKVTVTVEVAALSATTLGDVAESVILLGAPPPPPPPPHPPSTRGSRAASSR